MSDLLQHYNNDKGNRRFSATTQHYGVNGKNTHIDVPINFNANSDDCCPEFGEYNKQGNNCNTTCEGTTALNNCNKPQEQVIYNLQYNHQDQCYPEMLDICAKPSYKTDAFEIKEGVIMKAGKGITFKQMECNTQMPLGGIIVENNGVRRLGISGQRGSGLVVTNNGTLSEPNFIFNLNRDELRDYTGYTTEIVVNGRSYKPVQGIIDINSGGFGSSINNLKSPNGTISVTSILPGIAGIDIKPIKINNKTLQPDNDGHPINLVNGNNTTVSVDANNNVSVNVAGTVTSVNGQTGVVNIPTLNPTEVFQGYKTLTSGEATSLTGSGLDIALVTPTGGNKPANFVGAKTVLYKNGIYMTLADYTFTGTSVTSTLSFAAGDKLSWLIFKN